MLYQTTIVIRPIICTSIYPDKTTSPSHYFKFLASIQKTQNNSISQKNCLDKTQTSKTYQSVKLCTKPPHTVVIDPTNINKARQNY